MNVSTDEFGQEDDGYPYKSSSEYYQSYQYNNEQEEEEQQQHGVYNVMLRVLSAHENTAMVANFATSLSINLDS